MTSHKGVMVLYLAGGLACGMAIGPLIKGKPPLLSPIAIAGVAIAALALIGWNIMMYRKAAKQPDPQFPVGAVERFTRPVVSTVFFVVGVVVLIVF